MRPNVTGEIFLISMENSSTLKYRKELTPSIQFQPDRIFTRND